MFVPFLFYPHKDRLIVHSFKSTENSVYIISFENRDGDLAIAEKSKFDLHFSPKFTKIGDSLIAFHSPKSGFFFIDIPTATKINVPAALADKLLQVDFIFLSTTNRILVLQTTVGSTQYFESYKLIGDQFQTSFIQSMSIDLLDSIFPEIWADKLVFVKEGCLFIYDMEHLTLLCKSDQRDPFNYRICISPILMLSGSTLYRRKLNGEIENIGDLRFRLSSRISKIIPYPSNTNIVLLFDGRDVIAVDLESKERLWDKGLFPEFHWDPQSIVAVSETLIFCYVYTYTKRISIFDFQWD
jgi:hypothetical protein